MFTFSNKNIVLYGISALFIAVNSFLITKEIYYFALFPFAVLLAYLYVVSLEKVFLLITFLTPLSIPIQDFIPSMPFNMAVPTEPMVFILMLVFLFKLIHENNYPKKFIRHPLSLAIIFHLIWLSITTISSTMPMISAKFLLARYWYVLVFFFFAMVIFERRENVKKYLVYYLVSLTITAFYALMRHYQVGLDNQGAAYLVSHPFYNDHTAYGAILAFYLPIVLGFLFLAKNKNQQILILLLSAFFVFAIIHSYTRAAWLSLIAALGIWLIMKFRVPFYAVFISGILGILFFVFVSTSLIMKLEENKTDSSDNLTEHVRSMSNIRTDASNVERLNRWKCALRMFREKPVLGWGPGTYMFQYAPFQMERDRTVISTNFGNWGNAHSEYIGPLAESGLLGSLSFILIMLLGLSTGFRVYYNAADSTIKILSIVIVMGLTTYFVHGVLNNFLDTDKASVPFWGFLAILIVFDLINKENRLVKSAG